MNLFTATRTGQLDHIHTLIDQYGLEGNILITISTKREGALRANLDAAVDYSLFDKVLTVVMPDYPFSQRRFFRRIKVYQVLEEALRKVVEPGADVVHYSCNPNSYYVFFGRICSEIGADYRMVLVEEGLSSYKWSVEGVEWDVAGFSHKGEVEIEPGYLKSHVGDVIHAGRKFVERVVEMLVKAAGAVWRLGAFLWSIVLLLVAAVSRVVGVDLVERLHNAKYHFLPKKYHYGIVEHYEEGYFCFPEKMERGSLSFDKLYPLDYEPPRRSSVSDLPAGITLVANQRYGEYATFFPALMQTLMDVGVNEFYLKCHPREDRAELAKTLEKAKRDYPQLTIHTLPDLDGEAVEQLFSEGDFSGMLGLTTTSLMYCHKLKPEARIASIAELFRENYIAQAAREKRPVAARELQQFDHDRIIFTEIAPEIPQLRENSSNEKL